MTWEMMEFLVARDKVHLACMSTEFCFYKEQGLETLKASCSRFKISMEESLSICIPRLKILLLVSKIAEMLFKVG